VKIAVPPSIEDGPNEVPATFGSRALLMCDAIGIPKPTVTWKKDGAVIPMASGKYALQRTGSLQISSVTTTDSGLYECVAENDAGTASREVTLIVQGR
jgi:Immunoglobulin I-set domain